MSDCLHCDINELVQGYIDRGNADIAEFAAKIAESLADLILLAPENEQAKLMAVAGQFDCAAAAIFDDPPDADHVGLDQVDDRRQRQRLTRDAVRCAAHGPDDTQAPDQVNLRVIGAE